MPRFSKYHYPPWIKTLNTCTCRCFNSPFSELSELECFIHLNKKSYDKSEALLSFYSLNSGVIS